MPKALRRLLFAAAGLHAGNRTTTPRSILEEEKALPLLSPFDLIFHVTLCFHRFVSFPTRALLPCSAKATPSS